MHSNPAESSHIDPSCGNIVPPAHNILTRSRNAGPVDRNMNPVSWNIVPVHRNGHLALSSSATEDRNIASMLCNTVPVLCNVALVSHTSTPKTSTRGPRFICTAAAFRGSRVLIGDVIRWACCTDC